MKKFMRKKSTIKLVDCEVNYIEADEPIITIDFLYRGVKVTRLIDLKDIINSANESKRDGDKYDSWDKEMDEKKFGKAKILNKVVEV